MENKVKRTILSLVGLSALALLILKLNVDLSVIYSIKDIRYVFLAILLTSTAPVIKALRLKHLLLAIGEKALSIKNLIMIEYVTRFLFNIAPGKLHLPAKVILLNKLCRIRLRNGASIITFEYVLDMGLIFIFSIFALTLFKDLDFISSNQMGFILILIFLCAIVFFKLPLSIFTNLLNKIEQLPKKSLKKVIIQPLKLIVSIRETWPNLILNKEIYYIFLITSIQWGFILLFTEFLFLSADYFVPFLWILAVVSCGTLIGIISTIPGGLGVKEVTMILLYTMLGVPKEISIIVVLLTRLLSITSITLGYIFSLKIGSDILLKETD